MSIDKTISNLPGLKKTTFVCFNKHCSVSVYGKPNFVNELVWAGSLLHFSKCTHCRMLMLSKESISGRVLLVKMWQKIVYN